MTKQKDINNARLKLIKLNSKEDENLDINTFNTIRQLFDDIERTIKSKSAKTEDIYKAIKNDIGGISYIHFRSILSKIRKEKKETTPLPLPKTDKTIIPPKKPSDKLSTVNMDEIILQQEIDRSKYTVDDWDREWGLILAQYKSVRTPKEKYVVLGGDPKDVNKYTDSLSDIRIVSNMANNLFTRISNQYRRIIGR